MASLGMPKTEYVAIKEPLGRAVFEAWYFQKLKEEQETRKAKLEAEEEAAKKKTDEEEEKRLKAVQEYTNWLEEKKSAFRKSLRRKQRKESHKAKENEEHLAKIKKAEADWKATKLKEKLKAEGRAAKLRQKKAAEEAKKETKKMESEKQFQKWKQEISEKLKSKYLAEKQVAWIPIGRII